MKKEIKVLFKGATVGNLVEENDHLTSFSYDSEWLNNGFSISPFSLPLKEGVFLPKNYVFNGLFGVFSDSLPDAWGRLLIKRRLEKAGIFDTSEFFKLTLLGPFSMGALTYLPNQQYKTDLHDNYDYDQLSSSCIKILENKECCDIDLLYSLGAFIGGARPKANILLDNEHYIVKFNTKLDGKSAGLTEYNYSLCARNCGIDIPDTKLLASNICDGYFAIKRFDYKNGEKVHMVSAAGLLEYDYNAPSLDYADLIKLTKILTNDSKEDVIQMFRRMCFNVFAHNLDDHGKNFAFLYDDYLGKWRLSPAYDLTYSNTYYNEHTTSVNGKGKDITDEDLLVVGINAGLKKEFVIGEINNIKRIVHNDLKKYLH